MNWNWVLSMPKSSVLVNSMVFASCTDSENKNNQKKCTECDLCLAHEKGCLNHRILKIID
ncbi:MAG: hypothetical protein ACD_4C00381G0002 [uncultured bacterium (gcode 4)]|uniref:Uncharacterized protein n=1 Tax=uncultured bacterium (gcode 4) TaxID=1234023 RepID=K2F564_9BACT|nr:MAG: hypothetical protein ACD_4C00381G0002 [uncultured bacterium (gcode 4)]